MKKKNPPSCLLALGRQSLPDEISLDSGSYQLEQIFKHDFFAATAKYVGEPGKVVLKVGRKASFWGIPLGWIGRLHVRHEEAAYEKLGDVEAVPAYMGRWGSHGFAHEYVEGGPLRKGEPVGDEFFGQLREAIGVIHARGMAYVDLEKCENVLVGEDGKPYLIDFQISFRWPRKYGGELWPARWLRRRLQMADHYHVRKLQRRVRPDQLSDEELKATYMKPWYVHTWSMMTRPFTLVRRAILAKIDPRDKIGERGRCSR